MSTNEQARVTHEDARKALDSMDDYARMEMGVDAYGPRGVLERYIAQQSSAPAGGVSDALEQRAMLAWSGYWCDCNDANVAGNNRDAMRAALESTLSAPEPAAQGEVGVGVDVTSDGMHVCVRLGDTIVYSQFHPAPPAQPAERVPDAPPGGVLHALDQADVALGMAGLGKSNILRTELRQAREAVAALLAAQQAAR